MENLPDKENSSDRSLKSSEETGQISNRKKVVVNEMTNSVITSLPPELTEMLKAARKANNLPDNPETTVKKPSAEVEHGENRKKVVINELTNSAITQLPPELKEMLRAARQASNQKETTKVPPPPPEKDNNALIINEEGSIFGIQVNVSTRKNVLERMKSISKIGISNPGESIFKYDDLGIAFYFGETGMIQEITFSYPFAGATLKGLRIDDSLQRAIDLYGSPKMKTQAGAIWEKFAVFLKDYVITTIRLRSS